MLFYVPQINNKKRKSGTTWGRENNERFVFLSEQSTVG